MTDEPRVEPSSSVGAKLIWVGRIISLLVVLAFAMSALGKFRGGPELDEGIAHLGLPMTMVAPLAVLEITCAVIYAIPATSVLGAILLTGYMGGAICTHWQAGDPFVIQIVIGVCVWLGIFLREKRLWALIPLRTH